MSLWQWLCYLKITQGVFCFDCLSRAHYGSCCLSILFFLKLKCKMFKMMPCWYRKFVHSFTLYLTSDFSQYLSQTISPCPILPLNYPYTVTFDLVSGDLRGGNNKKKTLEKRNVAYTLFFTLFKKAFFWLWPGQKRKKTCVFVWCLTNNAVDHLTIRSN